MRPTAMVMAMAIVASMTVAACGDSRCDTFVDTSEAQCVADQTQALYVNGEKMVQLRSDQQARVDCRRVRGKNRAWCRAAPDDVLECEVMRSGSSERSSPRCQQLLAAHRAKTHPGEASTKASRTTERRTATESTSTPDPGAEPANAFARIFGLAKAGDFEQAATEAGREIAAREEQFGPDHPAVCAALNLLGQVREDERRPDLAISPYERALKVNEGFHGSAHWITAEARFRLARVLWDSDRDRKRAVELANAARLAFAADPKHADDVRRVDAWIAAHR